MSSRAEFGIPGGAPIVADSYAPAGDDGVAHTEFSGASMRWFSSPIRYRIFLRDARIVVHDLTVRCLATLD